MNVTAVTPILNVSDVPASLRWFEALGFRRCFTFNDGGMIRDSADADAHGPAQFASVGAGEIEIFLCHDGQGLRGGKPAVPGGDDDAGATWMTLWVGTCREVDEAFERARAVGATVMAPPVDEPWGVRELRLAHPDGHVFRVSAPVGR
ncbi:MAG: VOC family protein [Anaeromyxobacter sp.]